MERNNTGAKRKIEYVINRVDKGRNCLFNKVSGNTSVVRSFFILEKFCGLDNFFFSKGSVQEAESVWVLQNITSRALI